MPREFLLIPMAVWNLPITPTEKVILAEVVSLNHVGQCYASSRHFAELAHVSISAARKAIVKLEKGGYLIRKGGGVTGRVLYPCIDTPLPADAHPPYPQTDTPPTRERIPIISVIESKDKTTIKAKAKPKDLDEVLAAFLELGYSNEGEPFYNYYEANGWIQGAARKPIKDWKAAARNWIRNAKKYDNERKTKGYKRQQYDQDALKKWATKGANE